MVQKQTRIFSILLSVIILSSCSSGTSSHKQIEILRPKWDGINTTNLLIKFGDYVAFKVDSTYFSGILIDYDKDTSGVWFGFCLTNIHSDITRIKSTQKFMLMGDIIPESLLCQNCFDCVALEYIHETALNENNMVFIRNYPIDLNKINIGSRGAFDNLNELTERYNGQIELRKKKTTDCGIGLISPHAVRTKYLDLQEILK